MVQMETSLLGRFAQGLDGEQGQIVLLGYHEGRHTFVAYLECKGGAVKPVPLAELTLQQATMTVSNGWSSPYTPS